MFGQTFATSDILVVAVLVGLEALLSADNALVLAIMVRHLPKDLQKKALLYGLGGAFVFRFIAIILAAKILALWWLQVLGALYLLWLPVKHFVAHGGGGGPKAVNKSFWPTVFAVEMADIAFALDSVLAGVAMIKGQDKIWVVYFGAIIGVILLRFAAGAFVRLLERFPSLDHVAYLLVGWVGVKLAFMAGHSYVENYNRVNDPNLTWTVPHLPVPVFWGVLLGIAVVGGYFAYRKGNDEWSPTEIASLEEAAETLDGEELVPEPTEAAWPDPEVKS